MTDENTTTIPILKNLSTDFIKFIRFHLPNVDQADNDRRFTANLKNLMEHSSNSYHAVLQSLGSKLKLEIDALGNDNDQKLESIDIISYAVFDMKKLYPKLLDASESKKQLKDILSTLLCGLTKLSKFTANMELMSNTMAVVDQILDTFKSFDDQNSKKDKKGDDVFKKAIESFNELYVSISQNMVDKTETSASHVLD